MSYSLVTVANYFIDRAEQEGVNDLTPMKLLKLVYIANGWSLGIRGTPLFNEEVEAWMYGPVVRPLYHKVKNYRNNPITSKLPTLSTENPTGDDEELLDAVWENYKDYDGLKLSAMTHQPNSPWSETWEHRRLKGIIIPSSLIQEHYRNLLN